MSGITNISKYGMFSVSEDYFFSTYAMNKDVCELKRTILFLAKNIHVTIVMYVQRYDYGEMLINKIATCAVSFHYAGGSISKSTYFCGTLKAAERTFRVMQKAVDKHCTR